MELLSRFATSAYVLSGVVNMAMSEGPPRTKPSCPSRSAVTGSGLDGSLISRIRMLPVPKLATSAYVLLSTAVIAISDTSARTKPSCPSRSAATGSGLDGSVISIT